MTRRLKYGNKPTIVDGIRFASKAEARRWAELRLLEKAGKIGGLERQPRFRLFVEGVKICDYIGDFFYRDFGGSKCDWVVDDVKGMETEAFKLKAKLFRAIYPRIELRIIKGRAR